MAYYCICDAAGGIECILQAEDPEVAAHQPAVIDGGFYIDCHGRHVSDELQYVNPQTRELAFRKDYTLDALPLPCTVTIEGVEYHCTEQPEFSFDVPGEYTIEVDAGAAYLKKEFTIEHSS